MSLDGALARYVERAAVYAADNLERQCQVARSLHDHAYDECLVIVVADGCDPTVASLLYLPVEAGR